MNDILNPDIFLLIKYSSIHSQIQLTLTINNRMKNAKLTIPCSSCLFTCEIELKYTAVVQPHANTAHITSTKTLWSVYQQRLTRECKKIMLLENARNENLV